jgi:hypothetical protein
VLRQRLDNNGWIGEYIFKPKGMHWRYFRTFYEEDRSSGGDRPRARRPFAQSPPALKRLIVVPKDEAEEATFVKEIEAIISLGEPFCLSKAHLNLRGSRR